jgi:outer membrane protein OmpA-like peptidoglycan-associated protein
MKSLSRFSKALPVIASALALVAVPVAVDALRITPSTYSGTNGVILFMGAPTPPTFTGTLKGFNEAGTAQTLSLRADAVPTFSADGSKAVWGTANGSTWNIKIGDADGSGTASTIVSGTGSPMAQNPSISPDGTKVAFTYDNDLYVMSTTANQTISTSDRVIDSATGYNVANIPRFISNTKIAYIGYQPGGGCTTTYTGVYVKDLTVAGVGTPITNMCFDPPLFGPGSGTTRITSGEVDISPDGQWAIYKGLQDRSFVRIMKVDGTGSAISVAEASGFATLYNPTFSPDGTKVAYFGTDSKIYTASFNTSTGVVGTPTALSITSPNYPFVWAPTQAQVTGTTTTTSTTSSTTTTTLATTTTAAATTTTAKATITTISGGVYASAKPGITVTDSKVYTTAPAEVAADSAINVLTSAQNKVMDIETLTPSICLPNDDELVFIDEGKCIAQVVNAKTRAVLRTLKTTVVSDDISELKIGNAIVTLAPVYFDAMSSTLDATALARIKSIKAKVSAAGSVLVIGHSGTLNGNSPANKAIARDRAIATVAALKAAGATGPFAISGVGALAPASTGKTEADQAKNRRAVIVLIP